MKIIIHTPVSTVRRNGNHRTATEWAKLLRDEGHQVHITSRYDGKLADLLITLHGEKGHQAAELFRSKHPGKKIVLALTGTDIYPAPSATTLESMAWADGIIVLQSKAMEKVPPGFHEKTRIVIQSAPDNLHRPQTDSAEFRVCVAAHFRDVKDPLLTADAARRLPADSAIQIYHAGGILDSKYADLVAREENENPRYHWLGELSPEDTAELLASCHLMVLSSHNEGGARVVGEALCCDTPVLSTRIDGVLGLLGDSYPGFFPLGNADELAALLQQCETDPVYYQTLQNAANALKGQFAPEKERESFLALIHEVDSTK
tara:strand:- start:2328 stop:3281 length:954 start_codon:yes stop_codon:yes gene_type:complete